MTKHSRRAFLKNGALALGTVAASGILARFDSAMAAMQEQGAATVGGEKAKVYFTKKLSSESLRAMYELVSRPLGGKVAVKLHTGEPNGPNILPREWVKDLLAQVPSPTIVECNVLYDNSPRLTTEGHRHTLAVNGWDFSPVDIMDEHGDARLPVTGGKHLTDLAVGKNLLTYDSMLVLTHFKGHPLGGFGGSLKNIAIGCASRNGKQQIHLRFKDGKDWPGGEAFMERMVEGGKAVADYFGPRMVYINVLRNMSVDCDCTGVDAAPVVTPDLGIMASTDILAIDQACVDMIYALPEPQKKALVERIESRGGLRQLAYMKELGMGNAKYEIVTV